MRAHRYRDRSVIVAVVVIDAAAVLLLTGLTWVEIDAARPAPFAALHRNVSGRSAYPGLAGLAVVALLIAVLLLVTGVWARRLLAALLVGVGVWTMIFGVRGMSKPSSGRQLELVNHAVTTAIQASVHPFAPVAVIVAGALLAAAGLAAIVRSGQWSGGLAARYAAPAEARRSDDPWRSLDRGEDPTVEAG